jgi:hypothetical protein
MTNPVKGETTFEALGKSWRFKMGNMALVELENLFQKNIAAVLNMFQNSDAQQMTSWLPAFAGFTPKSQKKYRLILLMILAMRELSKSLPGL